MVVPVESLPVSCGWKTRRAPRVAARAVVEPGGGFPLHADDGRPPMRLRRDADRLQRLLLATLVMVRDRKVEAAQPGEVGLWKTDDSHVEHRGLLQEALDRLQPLCDRRRV